MSRRLIHPCLALALLAALPTGCAPAVVEPPPNVVLIVTDDQRHDTLWAMPILRDRLAERGLVFTNARVTTPLCSPSRAGFLSGGFEAHETRVLTNESPNGGRSCFDENGRTLAVRLHDRGYETAFVGKYMNGSDTRMLEVPRGWDLWWANTDGARARFWRAVEARTGGEASLEGRLLRGEGNLTDVQARVSANFLEEAAEPFFLHLAVHAPHLPDDPAPEDEDLFEGFRPRSGAWNEEDVSDKPAWIRDLPPVSEAQEETWDENARVQLRLLQSVDRLVDRLMFTLEARGVSDRTHVFLVSDNGVMWGEHRLFEKGLPYDPSLRVPLVVLASEYEPEVRDDLVAANLDVPAAILALTGAEGSTSGVDFLAPLRDDGARPRDHMLIQNFSLARPYWSGVVTREWKYVRWSTDEEELYDLDADPDENENLAPDWPLGFDLLAHRRWLAAREGLRLPQQEFQLPAPGQTFRVEPRIWGGSAPFTWEVLSLPEGLRFSGGVLSGRVDESMSDQRVILGISDSSTSPWSGGPQRFVANIRIRGR